jgi:hypothetical protein
MMRKTGVKVNDTPKIQLDDPVASDHSIIFGSTLRIRLVLHGVFSYLPTSKPSAEMLNECEEVYMLTPSTWNPHNPVYSSNEENMINWKGDMRVEEDMQHIILSDVAENTNISSAVFVGHIETKTIEDFLTITPDDYVDPTFVAVPGLADEVVSVLSSVNPLLNDTTLHNRLNEQCELGKSQMSIGSMNITDQQYSQGCA